MTMIECRLREGERELNYLLSFKVDKTVPSGLALQSPRLVEEEVKLLHLAKLLEELEEVVSVKTEEPMSPLLECCWLLSPKCR